MSTFRIALNGCDECAVRNIEVTFLDDPIALLFRIQEAFGTNFRMQNCAPGFEVSEVK